MAVSRLGCHGTCTDGYTGDVGQRLLSETVATFHSRNYQEVHRGSKFFFVFLHITRNQFETEV